MRLTVFGATGGTGRLLVQQALDAGHDVTAFVRDAARLGLEHERLGVVVGDVMDPAAVEDAVRDRDAVLCAIGAPASDRSRVRTRGTGVIIDAMERAGARRLVCLSSFGVGDSRARLPLHLRYLIVPLFLRHAFADHETQEARVRESDLDWTIVRPPHLKDGPHTGAYRHGFDAVPREVRLVITRADVADLMLRVAADGSHVREAVAVSS
jgi:putative NADH-flavin reductase